MKLEIVSSDRDHAILIGDEDHNDIAEFYHSDHATVSQSYETALALAKQLVECHAGVSPMTAPMTSREALQDALDEWAMANLPTESAGCITSWSDWIAAFVCDGVFGDSQMHPLSDIRDLDEAVRELGIQDSGTTPAEAVRELNAEIERLRSVAQACGWQLIETAPKDKDILAVRAEWWMPVNGNHRWIFSEIKLTRWLPQLGCFASGCEKQPTHWMPAPPMPEMPIERKYTGPGHLEETGYSVTSTDQGGT